MFDLSAYKGMSDEDFIKFLVTKNAIQFGDFVGKSTEQYNVETDIRCALTSSVNAMIVAQKIHHKLKELHLEAPTLGVPETGTLISSYVNMVKFIEEDNDFEINMVRSVPKEYQDNTQSVYTVLPLNKEQPYILIEDDVVTGNTVSKYLEILLAAGTKVLAVVVVFGRGRAKKIKDICIKQEIPYFELFSVEEIERNVELWDTGVKK